MRFKTLLIHRCTLLVPGEKVGEDEYGRDIIGTSEFNNVHCRVDQIRLRQMRDEAGTDFVLDNVLYLAADQLISLDTAITDIKDKKGNPVLQGSFSVESMNPIYDQLKLHHYEVALKRE